MSDPLSKEGREALRSLAAEALRGRGVVAALWMAGRRMRAVVCDPAMVPYFEALSPEVVTALLDRVDALEAEREKARKAWADCDARMEHYFRCEAPHDAAFTDPRCDCGLRALSEALS